MMEGSVMMLYSTVNEEFENDSKLGSLSSNY